MDEAEIQRLLSANDPDALEKYLAGEGSGTALDDIESEDEPDDMSSTGDTKNAATVTTTKVEPQPDAEAEALRRENAELQRQLEERERQRIIDEQTAADVEATKKKLDLLTQQLTKAGIEPAKLPDEMELTEEELAELGEYGDIGHVTSKIGHKIRALMATVETLQRQQAEAKAPAAAPEESPAVIANRAIDATPGLRKVMDDPALSKQAIDIDTRLRADPKWAGRPMTERFAEVMKQMTPRLMKDQPKQHDSQDVPYSLSGVPGATQDVTASINERLAGMTEAEISQYLALNPDAPEIAQLLASYGH